jgi:O-antigen/teichoic acid export membrane protein
VTAPATSLRTLARATGAYTSVTLLRALFMVAALPVLTRLLPAHEYALIALLTPIWWIGQSVLSLGTSESIARVVTDRPRGMVAGTYLGCALIVCLVSAVAMFSAPFFARPLLGVDWSGLIFWTVVVAALQSLVSVSAAALRGQRRVLAATVVMGTAAVGAPSCGLVAAAVTHTAEGYTEGMCVAAGLAVLLGSVFLVGGHRSELVAGARSTASCIRLGLPGLPQAAALLALDAGLRRVVLEGQGPDELTVYGLAAATGGLLWTLVRSAGLAWGPEIYSYSDTEVEQVVRKQVRLFVAIATVGAGAAIAVAPVATAFLVPSGYPTRDFTQVVAVLSLSGVVGVPFMALFQLCYRNHLTTALPLTTVPAAALVVAVAWVLRSHLPVELVAAGQPLTLLVVTLGLWRIVRRRTGVSVGPRAWWPAAGAATAVVTLVAVVDDSPAVSAALGAGLALLAVTWARQGRPAGHDRA